MSETDFKQYKVENLFIFLTQADCRPHTLNSLLCIGVSGGRKNLADTDILSQLHCRDIAFSSEAKLLPKFFNLAPLERRWSFIQPQIIYAAAERSVSTETSGPPHTGSAGWAVTRLSHYQSERF